MANKNKFYNTHRHLFKRRRLHSKLVDKNKNTKRTEGTAVSRETVGNTEIAGSRMTNSSSSHGSIRLTGETRNGLASILSRHCGKEEG